LFNSYCSVLFLNDPNEREIDWLNFVWFNEKMKIDLNGNEGLGPQWLVMKSYG